MAPAGRTPGVRAGRRARSKRSAHTSDTAVGGASRAGRRYEGAAAVTSVTGRRERLGPAVAARMRQALNSSSPKASSPRERRAQLTRLARTKYIHARTAHTYGYMRPYSTCALYSTREHAAFFVRGAHLARVGAAGAGEVGGGGDGARDDAQGGGRGAEAAGALRRARGGACKRRSSHTVRGRRAGGAGRGPISSCPGNCALSLACRSASSSGGTMPPLTQRTRRRRRTTLGHSGSAKIESRQRACEHEAE